MKKFLYMIFSVAALLLFNGCNSAPEYYEELTAAEQKRLLVSARTLALQGKAVPAHYQALFLEMPPRHRIVYTGNKRGKATFRWELYNNAANRRKLTQKDINPYWVMVYATGDLTDPKWKLTHAYEDPTLQKKIDQQQADSERRFMQPNDRRQRQRQIRRR